MIASMCLQTLKVPELFCHMSIVPYNSLETIKQEPQLLLRFKHLETR